MLNYCMAGDFLDYSKVVAVAKKSKKKKKKGKKKK